MTLHSPRFSDILNARQDFSVNPFFCQITFLKSVKILLLKKSFLLSYGSWGSAPNPEVFKA